MIAAQPPNQVSKVKIAVDLSTKFLFLYICSYSSIALTCLVV